MPAYARPMPLPASSSRRSSTSSQGMISQEEFERRRRRQGSLYGLSPEEIAEHRTRQLLNSLMSAQPQTPQPHVDTPVSPSPAQTQDDDADQEEKTHASPLPKSGLRGFLRQNLPMKLMNSRLVKYFTKLQVRPKVPAGNTYKSSGDFKIKSISPADAVKISSGYAAMATSYRTRLQTQNIDDGVKVNIRKSEEINDYIKKVADIYNQKNSERETAHFYMLKKKKDSDPFAIAVISDYDGVMNVRGVAIHPSAMLARLEPDKRQEVETHLGISIGKYDVKGLGTAISLLASIATSRKNKNIHSVVTNAVNPLSARIFEKTVGGKL